VGLGLGLDSGYLPDLRLGLDKRTHPDLNLCFSDALYLQLFAPKRNLKEMKKLRNEKVIACCE
jgi:hypothetical protein